MLQRILPFKLGRVSPGKVSMNTKNLAKKAQNEKESINDQQFVQKMRY